MSHHCVSRLSNTIRSESTIALMPEVGFGPTSYSWGVLLQRWLFLKLIKMVMDC
jgi:hypothetical protein